MPRIQFTRDPSWVTVGEGLRLAFGLWKATAMLWALPVFIVGVLNTLYALFLTKSLAGALPPAYGPDVDWVSALSSFLPGFIVSTLLLGTVSTVTRWIYLGAAVSGLRGNAVTAGWVASRGLRSLVADLMLTVVMLIGMVALVVIAQGSGVGLAVVLGLAGCTAIIYLDLRLRFWAYAIFDGAGVTQGARASWAIAKGGLLRVIGWDIAIWLVGLVPGLAIGLLTLPMGDTSPFRAGIQAAAGEMLAVFAVFAFAVLYESQRRLAEQRPGSPSPHAAALPTPVPAMPEAEPYDPNGPTPPPPPPSAPLP
ncbi:MAG: hypothetical protein WCK58_06930 [Chloroflexota bacterium]